MMEGEAGAGDGRDDVEGRDDPGVLKCFGYVNRRQQGSLSKDSGGRYINKTDSRKSTIGWMKDGLWQKKGRLALGSVSNVSLIVFLTKT